MEAARSNVYSEWYERMKGRNHAGPDSYITPVSADAACHYRARVRDLRARLLQARSGSSWTSSATARPPGHGSTAHEPNVAHTCASRDLLTEPTDDCCPLTVSP